MVDIDLGPAGRAIGPGQSRAELVPQLCPDPEFAADTPELLAALVQPRRRPSRIICAIPQDGALITALAAAKHEFEGNPAMGRVVR